MIAIVDYGMGNLQSVQNGFRCLGFQAYVTGQPEEIKKARGIILPGVGAFGQAVYNLREKGLGEAVQERAREGVPLLGICLGLQLLLDRSQESPAPVGGDPAPGGENRPGDGLGLVPGEVIKFKGGLKVPHMGWNRLKVLRESKLLKGVRPGEFFYFVHSYYGVPRDREAVLGEARYGGDFAAVIQGEPRVYGVQFHPEKSSREGLKILNNFGEMVRDAGHTGS